MESLKELLESGFGKADNYTEEERLMYGDVNMNCCERILYGANKAYGLGLKRDELRLAAPFGGGMGVGTVCGAISGSLMVLGLLYSKRLEKETDLKKDITVPFLKHVKKKQGSLNCKYNKAHYAVHEPKFDCSAVVLSIAECLDETVQSLNRN